MEEEGSAHSRRGIETRGTTLASTGGVSVSALHPRSPSNPSQLFIHSVNDRPSSVPGTGQTHRENAGRASSSTRQGGPRFPAELRGASSAACSVPALRPRWLRPFSATVSRTSPNARRHHGLASLPLAFGFFQPSVLQASGASFACKDCPQTSSQG